MMDDDDDPDAELETALGGPETIGYAVRYAMAKVLEKGLTDRTMEHVKKQLKSVLDDIESDIDFQMKENIAGNLSHFVCDMANKVVAALLAGDEKLMRQYLSCEEYGYLGRNHTTVIHGKLFESSPIEIRRKIVEAFPDLLKTERILDLESQVEALVKEVNREKARAEEIRESFR
jgi:hypothetical protein